MVEKSFLKKTGIIGVIILFMTSLGVNVAYIGKDQGYLPYSCAQENVDDMFCYKLSKVGTIGVNRYCYYDRDRPAKHKVCNAGWELMTSAIEIEQKCPYVIAYVTNCVTGKTDKYFCEGIGQDVPCKTEDELLMPFG